jgi:uncharacterized protein
MADSPTRLQFDLSLVLTHACNLACPYCYMGEHHATAMPDAIASRAIDLAFARADHVLVSFFGGEPLLAWDQVVRGAECARRLAAEQQKTLVLQVTTNATLLCPERADELARLGVSVAVSLDGTREAHDRGRPTRGGGSSYEAAIDGVEALRGAGVGFDVIAVTTPDNVAHLARSVRALAALGPRRILLNPSFGERWTDETIARWGDELAGISAFLLDRWRAGEHVFVNALDGKLAAAAKGGSAAHCSVGRWNVAVAPSGRLYPCDRLVADDRSDRFVIGHLDDGLDPTRALPRGPSDPECAPCAERPRCRASCACANIAETGAPELPGGVQCWYEQTTARLADDLGWALLGEQNPLFVERVYGAILKAPRHAEGRRLPVLP